MPDDKVQKDYNMFGTKSSTKAAAAGFPDFFVYKICEGYLFGKDMEIQFVEGNGNCLPTSIIKTLILIRIQDKIKCTHRCIYKEW